MKEIKWAVLGCGVIANEMAVALQKNGKNIYAVGNRTHEKAAAFAEKYGIGKVYDDFHEMFTDPEVDVIYITTPHNTHLGFMKEAIANGKHILVEKSITLNSDELDEAIALAKEKGVIIGEAMTIYHMPIYKELKKILTPPSRQSQSDHDELRQFQRVQHEEPLLQPESRRRRDA